jgi:hypothetical protein
MTCAAARTLVAALVVSAGLGAATRPATAQQASATGFRFERPVTPGAAGPNRLDVDLPLLSGAGPFSVERRMAGLRDGIDVAQGGLADFRLFDESGREVPYLVVQPPPRLPDWTAGRILPVQDTKKTSGFEVDLGGARLVDRLAIGGLPAPYLKRVRVEGSGDRARWTLLAGDATVFDLPDEQLTRQDVEFAAGEYRYLRVTWDDSSSTRLPLPRLARARVVAAGAAPPALGIPTAFERRASEPGVSRYRLSLPSARLPIVALDLAVAGGYVLRPARVVESRLDGAEMAPIPLGTATLRRAVRDDVAAAALRIPISPPQESQLELIVADGSNPPLELTGVTAVCAELPWIYFEASSTHPLVARFGAPRVAAPRYDLEAARPSLGRTPTLTARWGERVDRQAAAAATLPPPAVTVLGATIDPDAFTYRRSIPAGPRGLTALRLDAPVLAHTRFADLRIVTPASAQVAYLVERLDEPLTIDLAAPERSALPAALASPRSPDRAVEAGVSSYRLTLPEANLPSGRVVLETSARVFDREIRLVAEREDLQSREGRRAEWLAQARWRHVEPETPAPPLVLTLDRPVPAVLWLLVDEGDNSPLPVTAARLLLPAYRLRFFRETDEPLSLLYGRPDAGAPRYDLALLAPRLVGASAHEVWPEAPARSAGARGGSATATRLFWTALVAAVIVLLVLLARLLRTSG